MTLPTFFIIGAAKAGTSSLHLYLDQHPEVQMSANKEPRFFAGPAGDIPFPPDKVWHRDEYERLFDPAFPVRGESSTDYAAFPRRQGAAARISELVPEAKIVYMVRDPLERTLSHYKMGVALMGERRTLDEALGDLSDLRSPYIASSLYATQLTQYLRFFPQERIMLVEQADLLADRRRILRQVFEFLDVDPGVDREKFDERLLDSTAWREYSPEYLGFVNRHLAPRVQWVPKGLRRSVRQAVERVLWPPLEAPSLDGDVGERLTELYSEQAERLRELTGKSFLSWAV
jgi:hypothetical protein